MSFPHPFPPPDLRSLRADIDCKWTKLTKDCEDRKRRLQQALQHLKLFNGKMEETQKWAAMMRKKIIEGGDIFEDEADEALKR